MKTDRIIVRAHRPLRELTNDELLALDALGEHVSVLSDRLATPLMELSLLASAELGERDLGEGFP